MNEFRSQNFNQLAQIFSNSKDLTWKKCNYFWHSLQPTCNNTFRINFRINWETKMSSSTLLLNLFFTTKKKKTFQLSIHFQLSKGFFFKGRARNAWNLKKLKDRIKIEMKSWVTGKETKNKLEINWYLSWVR